MLRRRDTAIQAAKEALTARSGPLEAERASVLAQAQALAVDEQQGTPAGTNERSREAE